MLPCPVHGAVELWEENRRVWNLFWEQVAPVAIQGQWQPRGNGRWQRAPELNGIMLRWLIQLYPLEPPRMILAKLRAIFEEHWQT